MKPIKPVFMKTYGKQIRKVPAWLSPENRKQVFDSSVSTDGDISVFEPSNIPLKGYVQVSKFLLYCLHLQFVIVYLLVYFTFITYANILAKCLQCVSINATSHDTSADTAI